MIVAIATWGPPPHASDADAPPTLPDPSYPRRDAPATAGARWGAAGHTGPVTTTEERGTADMSIAEAAQRLGLSTHALRYYETEGLLVGTPARTPAGRRRYDERDLTWIVMVQRLRATGMPVREVREYAELVRAGEGTEAARLALLRAHRERVLAQLAEVTEHLGAITAKIEGYERQVLPGAAAARAGAPA
ncbi:hypothetical protein GCM10027586_05040 [Kineococcus gypseus]